MMNCPEVMELMNRYVDDDLNKIEISHLMEHLKQCSDCSEMFERLKHLSAELENMPKVMPKFSLVDAIMPQLDLLDLEQQQNAAVRETSSPSVIVPMKPRWRDRMPFRTLGGVVAAGFIVGLFLLFNKPDSVQQADMELTSVQESSADKSMVMNESQTLDKGKTSTAPSTATYDAGTDTKAADEPNKADNLNETKPADQGKAPDEPAPKDTQQEKPATVPSEQDTKSTPPTKGEKSGQQDHKVGGSGGEQQVPTTKPDAKPDTKSDPKSDAGSSNQQSKKSDNGQGNDNSGNTDKSSDQEQDRRSISQEVEDKGFESSDMMGLMSLAAPGFDTSLADAHMEVRSEDKAFRAVFDEHKLVVYNGKKKVLYKQTLTDGMVTNPMWSEDQKTFTFEFSSKNADGTFGEPELMTITPKKSKS
ncbi:hypothetical protein BVG16_10860 [Paenibacillus selenitireducens]|uniref:Anti-sigma-W factor RsiW n=1 Tax=Paenibacillus selenitireducens TaxID=1324314 RepID=A0A1T2XER2_9BACL|nr:zf-HC2 domain-containing protein [Paenibacillus selenitireducens]OPA78374.1 hypothetical protein BVG16_10860 [Paenibacillus selenitireducens]